MKYITMMITALLIATPVLAQDKAASKPKGPMKISADNALEWHRDQKQYIAKGNVVITQDDMKLTADVVVADYHDGKDTSKDGAAKPGGGMEIYRLTATGNKVVIQTATETAVGSKAVYDRVTNKAILEGPVTITRDKNILNGARAVVDLTTQLSTLYGDPKSGGRVTGVFYTEDAKKPK